MDQNDDWRTLPLQERTFLPGPVNQYATEDSKMILNKQDTCHPEEIYQENECKKSSTGSSDLLCGLHVGWGRPRSVVKYRMNFVEGGAEPLNCNINISSTQRNDDIAEKSELLGEDNSSMPFNKRLKKSEQSDIPTCNSENKEKACSSWHDLNNRTSTSLEQVDLQSVSPCFSGNISEKGLTARDGDGFSMEVVENTLLMEAQDCSLGFEKTTSNGDIKLLIDQSNQNTNENGRDSNVITITLLEENPYGARNDVVSSETDARMFAGEASSDACSQNLFLNLHDNEKSLPVAKDVATINEDSCDSDKLASNLLVEFSDEANKTVSNVQVHKTESKAENTDRYPGISSGDALDRDNHLHIGGAENSLASDADPSMTQLGDPNGVKSQIVGGSVSVALERSFARCREKKLLVLDVNGLLVDISSYVPYDYDPDEILLKKAIFKRPYCDDFLRFCFERFNVGVWSSRTKTNMEPILDFLIGKDKHKLLFRWDQSHCTYTRFPTVEKRHKPLILKKLKKLWEKFEPDLPWEIGAYNETNTLLIDDSPYKAICNPRHTAIFPYTYRFRTVGDNSLGPVGDLRVYLQGLAMAENVQEYVKQNPFGQRPITEKNLSWGFYSKVIKACSSPPRQNAEDPST